MSSAVSQSADLLPTAGLVADDLLGVPVQHDDDIDPAEPVDQDLRHVDAPPLVGPCGAGL